MYTEGRDKQERLTLLHKYNVWACWERVNEGCLVMHRLLLRSGVLCWLKMHA